MIARTLSGFYMVMPPTLHDNFKLWLTHITVALFFATICLFIRTVFRSVELSEGFSGKLANNEVEFMVLDGVMVILASIALTIKHPGRVFRKRWPETKFPFWNSNPKNNQEETPVSVMETPVADDKAMWVALGLVVAAVIQKMFCRLELYQVCVKDEANMYLLNWLSREHP